jgi:hypothetical protein
MQITGRVLAKRPTTEVVGSISALPPNKTMRRKRVIPTLEPNRLPGDQTLPTL